MSFSQDQILLAKFYEENILPSLLRSENPRVRTTGGHMLLLRARPSKKPKTRPPECEEKKEDEKSKSDDPGRNKSEFALYHTTLKAWFYSPNLLGKRRS
jgi:hypothetical protein